MDIKYPSIFNDVIGPVMRGPSSSHCAAALRIGTIMRQLMKETSEYILVEFDPDGSLATTHTNQGSDMGLFAGLMGLDATDERMAHASELIREAGIHVDFKITPLPVKHPNAYALTAQNSDETHSLLAISTGGGMIEILNIDGFPTKMAGDFHETLFFGSDKAQELVDFITTHQDFDDVLLHRAENRFCVQIKSQVEPSRSFLNRCRQQFPNVNYKQIAPVLPVLSRKKMKVPFLSCTEMLKYNQDKQLPLWELAIHYESARGNLNRNQILEKMREVIEIMETGIEGGLGGTEYADRILGYQSGQFLQKAKQGKLLDGGLLNTIIAYTTALMETKSAMGVIVAAPTAGSCGGLPGACIGAGQAMKLPREKIIRAMLAAGLIGVFIAAHATFAAEVGGCQAECGSGSGMAAAALVVLADGTTRQALNAASMALQSTLGMICDPVANRVEVPCLGKNVLAATNALACANMALADYDPVIPLDEVIRAMDSVGKMLPAALCCTATGGLSVTTTSRTMELKLAEKRMK